MRVPCEMFCPADTTPEKRLRALQDVAGAIFDAWPIGDPQEFRVRSKGHRVGGLVFNQVDFSPMRFHRTEKHLSRPGADFLVLEAMFEGEKLMTLPSCQTRVLSNTIYLQDWSVPFETEATAMRYHSILIPRRMLTNYAEMEADHPVLSWSMDAPAGQSLMILWSHILSELDVISLEEAQQLCAGLLGYVSALVGSAERASQTRTLAAMKHYLRARLRGKIGPEDLCTHFGVSRSTVFRLFQPEGGVRRFVNGARLDQCRTELWLADPARVKVADVALAWGFPHASTFARSFHDRFGVIPSSVLGKGRGDGRNAPGSLGRSAQERYGRWFDDAVETPK